MFLVSAPPCILKCLVPSSACLGGRLLRRRAQPFRPTPPPPQPHAGGPFPSRPDTGNEGEGAPGDTEFFAPVTVLAESAVLQGFAAASPCGLRFGHRTRWRGIMMTQGAGRCGREDLALAHSPYAQYKRVLNSDAAPFARIQRVQFFSSSTGCVRNLRATVEKGHCIAEVCGTVLILQSNFRAAAVWPYGMSSEGSASSGALCVPAASRVQVSYRPLIAIKRRTPIEAKGGVISLAGASEVGARRTLRAAVSRRRRSDLSTAHKPRRVLGVDSLSPKPLSRRPTADRPQGSTHGYGTAVLTHPGRRFHYHDALSPAGISLSQNLEPRIATSRIRYSGCGIGCIPLAGIPLACIPYSRACVRGLAVDVTRWTDSVEPGPRSL